jgi:hypothetical protein
MNGDRRQPVKTQTGTLESYSIPLDPVRSAVNQGLLTKLGTTRDQSDELREASRDCPGNTMCTVK